MLRLIGLFFRLVVFSLLILILSNWFRWEGRTISDQVKIGMAHAEKSQLPNLLKTLRGWAETVTHDAREGARKKPDHSELALPFEELSSSERQKLKVLIRELNSSRKRN